MESGDCVYGLLSLNKSCIQNQRNNHYIFLKTSFSLPVIVMYVLAGVSGSQSSGMSALRTKGFSPVQFGMRNG